MTLPRLSARVFSFSDIVLTSRCIAIFSRRDYIISRCDICQALFSKKY
nr:MAG TPA: tax1-binding protein [Caudoviricetes sp.]